MKIDVTAAIIKRNGRFLIAKRKKGMHLENKWEFPGGKIESLDTSPEECLKRELKEELGINVRVGNFVAESIFDYGDRTIRLLAYQVEYLSGKFKLNAHEEIKWVNIDEFGKYDFAEADLPLIEKILVSPSQ